MPAIKVSMSICGLKLKNSKPPANMGNVNNILSHNPVKGLAESPRLFKIPILLSMIKVPINIGIPIIK